MLFYIMKICSFVLLAFLGPILVHAKSYDGYQVYRTANVNASNIKQFESMMKLPHLDFWSTPREGRSAVIMTSPEHVTMLTEQLINLGLEPQLLITDLENAIQQERDEIEHIRIKKSLGRAPQFDRYLKWDEIEAYLDEVVATFPSIASLITIGRSYEGRPMRVLKLSNGPGKSAIWFDAAAHAREWAGPPTLLYAINQLTENLAENQAMLDANDFYFLLVANPDGYVYTWMVDRMWRKTMNTNEGTLCFGTDPNRNYDYAWGLAPDDGPCFVTYAGPSAFSAPETQAVRDFLTENPQITFLVNVHSYGQYLLYPWGDTSTPPPTEDELKRVGRSALDALEAVKGTKYEMGSTYNVLYAAYGLSEDWAYAVLGIPLVFVIELPGGNSGFNPPASDILPVVTETWEAYKVFAANIPASRSTSDVSQIEILKNK